MGVAVLIGVVLAVLGWTYGAPWMQQRRRARAAVQPFPEAWREHIRRRVPAIQWLPADLQLQLKKHIQVFLAEKPFIGCQGLEVSDEMRVTIAAQACLLLLNRRSDGFPRLTQVLVYPDSFVVDREVADDAGLLRRERRVLSGEAWDSGQVILSWADVLADAAHPEGGRNVVIHEFAHHLDQETGGANGAPFMVGAARRARWARVMNAEFEALCAALDAGERTLLDPYAATGPAEFFAVASEVFFGRPLPLAERHPELYAALVDFFRVDPRSW